MESRWSEKSDPSYIRNSWTYTATLLQTTACTSRPLKRLEELLTWAWMKIKPANSHSLLIRKGASSDNISFSVDGEEILHLADQPLRSLGRLYTADLYSKHMAASVTS